MKEAGDVIFIVSQQKHELFKRKGADLLLTKEITLLESIVGADFVVNHLDGTPFHIQSAPGQVIQPGQIMTIKGKGMPFHKKSWEFGNLFIMFKVIFPKTVTTEQQQVARACLSEMEGQQPNNVPPADMSAPSREVRTLEPF